MSLTGFLLGLSGFLIAWVIGANDAANSMGTAVGARVRTEREAVFLVSIFGIIGAVFMGGRVVQTLGEGVIPLPDLPMVTAQFLGLSAMVAAGLTILICTFFGLPVSTSHAIVGGLVGGGISAGLKGLVNWAAVGGIFGAWILTPLASAAISLGLLRGVGLLKKLFKNKVLFNNALFKGFYDCDQPGQSAPLSTAIKGLLTFTGCYMAFSWGANDVANAAGIISGVLKVSPRLSSFLGGLVMSCGVLLLGKKVMATVGKRITRLTPFMALVAEFSAALTVNFFTVAGLPVSTTHAIVGAVGGIGWAKKKRRKAQAKPGGSENQVSEQGEQRDMDLRLLGEILLTWFLTPLVTGSFAFFFLRLFQVLHQVCLRLHLIL